jgi:hypothetical protein
MMVEPIRTAVEHHAGIPVPSVGGLLGHWDVAHANCSMLSREDAARLG